MKDDLDQFDILVANLEQLRDDRDWIGKFEKKWTKIIDDRYSEMADQMRKELPEWKHYLETMTFDNWTAGDLYKCIEYDLKRQLAEELDRTK